MLVLIQVKNVQCQLHVMVEQHASIIYVLVQQTAISPIIFALYDNSLNHVGFFFFYLTNFILLIAWYVRYVDSWNSKFSNLFKSFISVYLGSACALIDYCQRNSQCIRGYCICNSDQVVDANGYCISKLSNPLEQRGWNKFETKAEKKKLPKALSIKRTLDFSIIGMAGSRCETATYHCRSSLMCTSWGYCVCSNGYEGNGLGECTPETISRMLPFHAHIGFIKISIYLLFFRNMKKFFYINIYT